MIRYLLILILGLMTMTITAKSTIPDTYATFKTSLGDIVCQLFPDKAPETVANFVGLATGKKEWVDSTTGEKTMRPLYTKTVFHRIIPDFMIQGGDPLGNGTGGPGYLFKDEFSSELSHDRAGRLSMANRGPGTNGSQFFITLGATPWLNNHHTVFGQVMKGQDIVAKIVSVKRDGHDRPIEPIVLEEVIITTGKMP